LGEVSRALGDRELAPALEGAARGAHGGVDVLLAGGGDFSHDLAGPGIVHVDGVLRARSGPLAVDVELVAKQHGGSRVGRDGAMEQARGLYGRTCARLLPDA